MKLIVGLGNPGPEYARTRHNAGFMLIDRIAHRHKKDFDALARTQFHALSLDLYIGGEKCLLLKPMTFMNKSGLSVGEAATFYKIPPCDVMILVDDLALECGMIRMRAAGSAGGHNGLIDIERALGTQEYPRLRLGIDPRGRVPQSDYVLGRFNPSQLLKFDSILDRASDAVEAWITKGIDKAMTQFNSVS